MTKARKNEPKTLTIANERIRIEWDGVGRDNLAEIAGLPGSKKRTIRFRPSLRHPDHAGDLLNALVHEILHAELWQFEETWIDQCATDMARALRAFGFTRSDD